MKFFWVFLTSTIGLVFASTPTKRFYDTHAYYAIEYSPKINTGISLVDVADALGVEIIEQAGELRDVWILRVSHSELEARSLPYSITGDAVLDTFNEIRERANSFFDGRSQEGVFAREIASSVTFLERQIPRSLVKRAPPPIRPPSYTSADGVAKRLGLNDPLFAEQWHLINEEYPEHMMNTTPVWDMGFTGRGVHTSFLDDGLDFEHDDLKDAFDAENSYDFNEHVPLPRPVSSIDNHGTRCAGQVAARRNDVCGVGIAYDAKAAGVRMLGGPITYVDEASALNYGFKQVSLYSCSWGPRDDGRRMEGPGYLVRKAVVNGINEGRDGKGSIFVFASGNGGDSHDQCNFDGYTNSIYSVTVSAVDFRGHHPSYSEECTANMIVAYTSGSGKHIVTTDRGSSEDVDKCTHGHSGTSAAAPNAVGVFALALQARPELTWRDIQHLCVETARIISPDDGGWERTASGRLYSNKFGYGALDAYAYVKAAQSWKLVKPQAWLHTETIRIGGGQTHDFGHGNYTFEGGERIRSHGFESVMTITKEAMQESNLEKLEHMDIRVWISHSRRGDVEVEIVSPNEVKSVLARKRPFDDATTGFPGWRFMTVKHWGENPIGEWTLKVFDQSDSDESGKILGWNMVLWGSSIDPSKAIKYAEPVVDNILSSESTPHRPVVSDPVLTSSTQHAKPTDHLPPNHLPTEQGSKNNSDIAHPQRPVSSPEEGDSKTSLEEMARSQKWYFMSIGIILGLMTALGFYLWRRRAANKKMEEYTSLATNDDIHMENVADNHFSPQPSQRNSTLHIRDPSLDSLTEHPPVEPRGARQVGFHSGFLDDEEELSPPIFRKGPGERPMHPLSESPGSANQSGENVSESAPWLVIK